MSQITGIVFVWAMTRVYQIDTVPTVHRLRWPFPDDGAGRPAVCHLLLRAAGTAFRGTFAASVSVLALLLSVAVIVLQSNELATLHSSVQQASALLPDYGAWQVGRIILVAAGLGCWLCPLIRRRAENPRALCRHGAGCRG